MLRKLGGWIVVAAVSVLSACGGGGTEPSTPDAAAKFASASLAKADAAKCASGSTAYATVNGECLARFPAMQVQAPSAAQKSGALAAGPLAVPSIPTNADLFAYAAAAYPQLFYGGYGDSTITVAPFGTFYYRAFGSGNLVAVLGSDVYAYGPGTGYTIFYVAPLSYFTCYVYDCNSGTGAALTVGSSVTGSFSSVGGHVDHTVLLNAGTTYTFNLVGNVPLDPILQLYNPAVVQVAVNDDVSAGVHDSQIVYTAVQTGTFTLRVTGYGGTLGSYTLSASGTTSGGGGNGGTGTGSSLSPGSSVTGSFATAGGHVDHSIFLSSGTSYTFNVVGGTLADTYLNLLNPSNAIVASDDDSGDGTNSQIVYTPTQTGTFILRVSGYQTNVGSYTLSAAYTSSGGGGTGGGTVDWNSAFAAEELIEWNQSLSVGAAYGKGFTISNASAPMEVIFASRYTANLYVTTGDTLQACVNGGSFQQYSSFSFAGQIGFKSFTLAPGSYGLCLRNASNSANQVRVEFQDSLTVEGFHLQQAAFDTVIETVQPGGRIVQPVTVGNTYRVLIDGGNSGGTVQIIPSAQQSAFLSGGQYSYYDSLSSTCTTGTAGPGLCELPQNGSYGIAYVNDTALPQAIVITGRVFVPD